MNASFPPPEPEQRRTGDPLIDERLARMEARRAACPPAEHIRPPEAVRAGRRPRRAHAARGGRAAALALSVTTTAGLAAYLRQIDAADGTGVTSAVGASAEAAGTIDVASTTAEAASTSEAVVQVADAASSSTSGLADGSYPGDVSSNRWGDVQVQITVTDGEITEVTVLQYPDEDDKSIRINQQALPTLISATLTAQSSDVDTVSGATYTSEGYRESLQTAIDDARAAATA